MKNDTKDVRTLINEMRQLMNEKQRTIVMEQFILPEDIGNEFSQNDTINSDETINNDVQTQTDSVSTNIPEQNKYSDIQKEIIQIRKIALSVITRLADNPSSESYDLMKKIWNMIDKVNDNKNELQKN